MTTALSTLLTQIRHEVSDNPLKVEDRLYSDRQLSDFVPNALDDMNNFVIQQVTHSGTGPKNMVLTPTLVHETRSLFILYVAKSIFQFENDEARRVGFRVTNVAGTVDGRGRYLSTREGIRDINTRINKLLKRQQDRAGVGGITYRSNARKADPDNTTSTELT
jgi:hypothetical protein